MCGLVGMIGGLTTNHERMFKYMLQLDTMRGADSTGMLSVSMAGVTSILKGVGTPWQLADSKRYDKFFTGFHKVLLGHNRSATRGNVSVNNAHPFEFDDIIGAHNGTLRSTYELVGHGVYDVDSEVLFKHIDTNGIDDAMEKVDGALALSWYDKSSESLYLLRNNERPLHYIFEGGNTTLIWASEPWMIRVAAGMAGVKLEGEIISLPVGEMMSVELPDYKTYNVSAFKPLIHYTRTMKFKPVVQYNSDGGYVHNHQHKHHEKKETPATTQRKDLTTVVAGGKYNKPQRTLFGDFFAIFEVTGTSNEYGSDYIVGTIRQVEGDHTLSELKGKQVRLYTPSTGPLFKLCRDSLNFFRGKVKHWTHVGEGYYALYQNEVTEYKLDLEEEEEESEETYLGYGGTILDWKGWKNATKNGCIQCGDPANHRDDGLVWSTQNEFLCGICAEEYTSSRFGGNV